MFKCKLNLQVQKRYVQNVTTKVGNIIANLL